jgi:hypothetical protein
LDSFDFSTEDVCREELTAALCIYVVTIQIMHY